jgi:hypothetical protein
VENRQWPIFSFSRLRNFQNGEKWEFMLPFFPSPTRRWIGYSLVSGVSCLVAVSESSGVPRRGKPKHGPPEFPNMNLCPIADVTTVGLFFLSWERLATLLKRLLSVHTGSLTFTRNRNGASGVSCRRVRSEKVDYTKS